MPRPQSLAHRLSATMLLAGSLPALGAVAAVVWTVNSDWAPPLWESLAIGGALVALTLVAGANGHRLGRRISAVLQALNRQADSVARGDLNARMETRLRAGEGFRDELDQVAGAFNLMTARLAQQITERDRYDAELRELNADLEQRVEQRTHELQETQRQLIAAEKSAALGQLVAGIAHEINNNVNFITGALEPVELGMADLRGVLDAWHAAGETLSGDALAHARAAEQRVDMPLVEKELAMALRQMREGSQRIRAIVANLRTFSHTGAQTPEPTDLAGLVQQTLDLARGQLPEGLTVSLDLEAIPPVPCLPVQMSQVLVNLLLNSVDATPGEGTIAVHVWQEADEACLSVEDTGTGIAPEHLPRVFDPFFTTKEPGKGTGLGLYVCQQILEAHGGRIEIESILGEGTEVTCRWPLNEK